MVPILSRGFVEAEGDGGPDWALPQPRRSAGGAEEENRAVRRACFIIRLGRVDYCRINPKTLSAYNRLINNGSDPVRVFSSAVRQSLSSLSQGESPRKNHSASI